MVKYVEILNNKMIKLYNNSEIIIRNQTFKEYINELLIKDLTDIEGRLKAIKSKYGYKKLIPIYIRDDLCFIPLENTQYNKLYINIYSIVKILNNEVIFIDGEVLKTKKNFKTLKNYIMRAKQIKK